MSRTFDYATSEGMRPAPQEQLKPAVSVFGLGYVGAVSCACLAEIGAPVHGVDLDRSKVDMIAAGRSPIVEKDLDGLLTQGVRQGMIRASDSAREAILKTEISFVSVGTPTGRNGECDLSYLRRVARDIGYALARKTGFHLIVLRCSVPPGATLNVLAPELEFYSGKRLGEHFDVCFNPEFLREGVAIEDFRNPPKTVIGVRSERAAAMMRDLYADFDLTITTIEVAEMVKYVDNVWHAAKVSFANEIGRLCKPLQIDSHRVMEIFVQDTKLNLSPYYLKPGFAFGGSCLPKEVRAVASIASELGVSLPMIESLSRTNEQQIRDGVALVRSRKPNAVLVLGLAFKPDTDDLRESPFVELAARLHHAGVKVRAYDPNLTDAARIQETYGKRHDDKPHLAAFYDALPEILVDRPDAELARADVVVASHATERAKTLSAARRPGATLIDLARLYDVAPREHYDGIAW